MSLTPEAVALAQTSRETCVIFTSSDVDTGDMSSPALLTAFGPDAASFLHSQLTNEVSGLAEGEGNLNARVARTGHIEHFFSLHHVPGASQPTYWMVAPRSEINGLFDSLDGFLFSDDLTLSLSAQPHWIGLQGPQSAAILEGVFGPLGFEPWSSLPSGAIRALKRAKSSTGLTLPEGVFALRRSLGGDVGFLLAAPTVQAQQAIAQALISFGATVGANGASSQDFSPALQCLRVEAGLPHLPTELEGKRRLLPELGLEGQTVSYTKGCYLGQEVIARVRTYGSVPTLLRAILLPKASIADGLAWLETLPGPGTALMSKDTGKRIGHLSSRAYSPTLGRPVAIAYLNRANRAPGQELSLQTEDGTVIEGTVALLPLYSAPDQAARVQQLYDRAIRTFAGGDEQGSLSILEECLRLDPAFADGYEAIGVILGRSGRFHEAIDFFRRLEEVAPSEPMVNTNLSLYYMKIGDKETAENESSKATLKSMTARSGKSSAKVSADLEASKRKDALRKKVMFGKVLAFDPEDPIALFGLGSCHLTLGEAADAIGVLVKAIEVDKNNSAVYTALGKAYEANEEVDAAIETYREGVLVASKKGDLMPLREMEHRLLLLGASRTAS